MDTQTLTQRGRHGARIARRKGVRVRWQDIRTAKMGPWVTDPIAEAARHDRVRLAERERIAQRMAVEVRNYWRQTDAALRVDRLTVRELQTNLRSADIGYTSRMRKAQLVALLLGTEGDS